MTIDDFASLSGGLRLEWLETFLSVAALGSYEAAARELRIHSSVVGDRIASLERSLHSPLLNTQPALEIMVDGENLIPLAIEALSAMKGVLSPSVYKDYDKSIDRVLKLTVLDLNTFRVTAICRNRKEAMHELGISPPVISKRLNKVKESIGLGELFNGISEITLSKNGVRLKETVNSVLRVLADFERRVSISYALVTEANKLSEVFRLAKSHNENNIGAICATINLLSDSKKGKYVIAKKKRILYGHLDFRIKLGSALNDLDSKL